MSILVREGYETDFPAVLMLIKELATFQHAPEKVLNTVVQMKSDAPLFRCFVAENEAGEIVGIATYFIAYFSWVGKSLYLDDLYVTASQRGHGAGSLLLNKIFETARMEDCQRVRWQVSDWNTNAIKFYEKCGAEIDREVYNCDFDRKAIEAFRC